MYLMLLSRSSSHFCIYHKTSPTLASNNSPGLIGHCFSTWGSTNQNVSIVLNRLTSKTFWEVGPEDCTWETLWSHDGNIYWPEAQSYCWVLEPLNSVCCWKRDFTWEQINQNSNFTIQNIDQAILVIKVDQKHVLYFRLELHFQKEMSQARQSK